MENLVVKSNELIKDINETFASLESKLNQLRNVINGINFKAENDSSNNDELETFVKPDNSNAYDRLKFLASIEPKAIRFNEDDKLLYIRHIYLGEVAFKVIGYNVDGEDCITLMATKVVKNLPFDNLYTTSRHTNWKLSTIRQWLNNQFYNGLPYTIKKYLVEVENLTYDRYLDFEVPSSDRVWVLSVDDADYETTKYDDNVLSDYGIDYWLRSNSMAEKRLEDNTADYVYAYQHNAYNSRAVNIFKYSCLNTHRGVVPCFVIK